ncbi:LysM peptidoglycan-binding domain-containing protein [Devosia sp. Root635]|uniref:LysM peptidoglycan-binding domain-containing protein n=1 Tax=Devosia sp. Root635 TaxID=1736575 RepID=UPI0006FF1F54|nr:LysM peptidoglycan-binding domain-containing protein [Devosia sp. Root635]KRA52945.1 hypothetical protein ASD80_14175 [Devosia sp. Root635]
MLAGPSVVTCFNSEDGMGVCLRGKMTDAGILPAPAPAATAEAEAPAPEQAAVVEPAIAEPALDVTPAPEVPDDLIAATFGLLRAEPDGSVVIAGSGTPGSEIEVYSGESLLGKATVESSGDWVLVPDAPIAPGGTEITLAEVGKTGRAAQSFVVVINDDKTSEPLVVASTPGSISEVLQGLDRPGAETTTQLAAVDPVAPPAAVPAPAAIPTPAPVAEAAPAPAAELPAAPATTEPAVPAATPPAAPETTPAPAAPVPAAEPPAAPATEPEPTTEPAPAPEPVPAAEPAADEPAPEQPTEPAPAPEPAAPATEPTAAAVEPAIVPAAPAAETPAAVPTAEPPAPAPEAPVAVAAVPTTIDAIEIEGDRTFFAGAGPEGATMRLYVEDEFIADATVADGRWLVEAGKVLTQPEQRVRIDMLQPGTATVAARAEVDFVVELPATQAPTAIAEATSAEPASPEPSVEPTPAALPAEPAPVAAPTQPAEPAVEPAPTVQPATTEPAPVVTAQAEPAPAPEPVATPAEPAPAAPEPAVPTLVAVAVGGPDAERFASGKAIIRRGDNLWTIARRVYGEGIKYTTIYDANAGQIRDPDRIYPGQVFDLPN